jgi:azurin
LELRFSEPLDPAVATDVSRYELKQWTYSWNSSYGSRQGLFSVVNPGQVGPDPVELRSIRLSADRRSVFLEIPSLVPGPAGGQVPMMDSLPDQIAASMGMVMAIDYKLRTADGAELNQTIHKTIHRVPMAGAPAWGGAPTGPVAPTPAARTNGRPPGGVSEAGPTETGRVVQIGATGINLAYDVKEITARAGELLTIRFINGSDMAHNVVLLRSEDDVRPVGNAAAQAYDKEWIPSDESERILAFTAVAEPGEEVTTTFVVPPPGSYPYICTYSGHWTMMRGVLVSTN